MFYLAQSYNYNYSTTSSGPSTLMLLIYLAYIVLVVVVMWKMFEKAGVEGWKALIPIYNTVILWRLVGMSGWFTLLFFVPLVNVVAAIYLYYKVAQAYGFGIGMTILEILSIGFIIVGFGDAKYQGPNKGGAAVTKAA
jgi:hypothetical protein